MNTLFSDDRLLTRLFFRLLPYQVLLLIVDAGNGIIDGLCASNFIGREAMGAVGFYSPLSHLLFAVSIMLVSGSQLFAGEAMGKGDKESVKSFFSTDLISSFLISCLLTLLLVIFAATDMTSLMVSDASDRRFMNAYIIGQSLGIPALIMGQQLFAFLSMENKRKLTMMASLLCFCINSVSDIIFIRFFRMGTFGLGLASAIALWVFFSVMAAYYLSGRSGIGFSLKAFRADNMRQIIKRGYPGAVSRFAEMFRCVIVNMLILKYTGSIGLSAFAAVNSVMAVFWPVPFGMMTVTRMLLGVSIGEEDRSSIEGIMRIALTKGVLLQCLVSAFIMIMAVPFTSMFYHSSADAVYPMTLQGFLILPLCMPLSVICVIFVCYGQAMRDRFFTTVLPILDGAVFVSLLSALLIPAIGIKGLYIANVLNGVFCTAAIAGYIIRRSGRIPRNMGQILAIPKEIGVGRDDRIDIEITKAEEVTLVSEKVMSFCREHGLDERKSYFGGLALEEMAGNIVEHGFIKDNRKHEADIRVAVKGDELIIRLTDNCVAFDPIRRLEEANEADAVKNIGIRLVMGITKQVSYQNLLGLNVLTIRL